MKAYLQRTGLCFFILTCMIWAETSWGCDNSMRMSLDSSVTLTANSSVHRRIRVSRNTTGQACSFFIAIENGTASSYQGRALYSGAYQYPVQIYKDAGRSQIVKSLTEAFSAADVLTGSFQVGATDAELFYYPYLEGNPYQRFGFYSQNFVVRLYQGNPANTSQIRDTRSITLSYSQQRRVDLSLVEVGAPFNPSSVSQSLNFGPLVTGAAKTVDMVLRYNAGYRVSIRSANSGKIVRESGSGSIPYNLTVNGTTVPLNSTSSVVTTGSGVSPQSGTRLPLAVTIGNISGAKAGRYVDTVTFTVSSAE